MWCAIASPPGPLGSGPDGDRVLAEGARKLRQRTDRAIIGLFGGNLLEIGQFLYRIDNFLMLLAGDPGRAHAFLDRLVEIHLANLERFSRPVGPYIDIIVFGDDLGMQNGPQMSPGHVPRVLQAAPRPLVEAGEGIGQRQGHAPLLRRRAAAACPT